MGAAEHIEWSGEYPALLWCLHPCEWSDDPIEPVNDNAQRLRLIERHSVPQSEQAFPHARAGVLCDNECRSVESCTPSTRQGEAQLAQAHRAEQAGGWGLPNYRFTGKEEDVEVGLQYFGKRYLNPLLGRWVSADPLAIHAPGEADLNVYAYVRGRVLKNIDPLGLEDEVTTASDVTDSEGNHTVTLNDVHISAGLDDADNSYSYGGAGGGASYLDAGGQSGHRGAPSQGRVEPEGGDQGETAQGLLTVGAGAACAAGLGVCAAGVLLGKSLEAVQDSTARNEKELKEASDASSSAQFMGGLAGAIGKLGSAARRLFVKEAPAAREAANAANHQRHRAELAADHIIEAHRSGSGLKGDASHRAASFLSREQLAEGQVFDLKGGDGVQRTLLQTQGGMDGKKGIYEYIIDRGGDVTHQRFIEGGAITGTPNQPKGGPKL